MGGAGRPSGHASLQFCQGPFHPQGCPLAEGVGAVGDAASLALQSMVRRA